MKYLRYLALLAVVAVPLAYSQAEVHVAVGIGFGPGYVAGPPVCAYGYYPYYPYTCAPYGYYGPTWFANGVFVGAGPWYHGWGRPVYPRAFHARPVPVRPYVGRPVVPRGYVAPRSFDHGRVENFHGGGFHGRR